MNRCLLALVLLIALAGCGGGGSSSSGGGGGGGGGGVGGGGTPPPAPTPVTVSGGLTQSGVNINVVSPASATPPNASSLGNLNITNSAFSTGSRVSRSGGPATIFLFGNGLSGSMQVFISNPSGGSADLTVSNVSATSSTSGLSGIQFTVTPTATTALGSRTVILQAANGDVTTFTGSLEVVP